MHKVRGSVAQSESLLDELGRRMGDHLGSPGQLADCHCLRWEAAHILLA